MNLPAHSNQDRQQQVIALKCGRYPFQPPCSHRLNMYFKAKMCIMKFVCVRLILSCYPLTCLETSSEIIPYVQVRNIAILTSSAIRLNGHQTRQFVILALLESITPMLVPIDCGQWQRKF